MQEKRFYQRFTICDEKRQTSQADVKFDGMPVRLVDYSLGGLSVLSEKSYDLGDIVNILVDFGNPGQVDLIGKVVRVIRVEKAWSVAVDLTANYKIKFLRK